VRRPEQDDEERSIFRALLSAHSRFSGEKICSWELAPHDPPDVICVTESGKIVGVEIAQWAHELEMAAGKGRECVERDLKNAIGHQPRNRSNNFSLVVFSQRGNLRLLDSDRSAFRVALFELIGFVDRNWPARLSRQTYRFRDLARFPPVEKYLAQIQFVVGTSSTSPVEWIVPVTPTDSFDDLTMLTPLRRILEKKAAKCRTLKMLCDSLYLAIAYDQALGRCSQVTVPTRSILNEMAAVVRASVHSFSSVYLLARDEVHQIPTELIFAGPRHESGAP
jgi:hypothetical protein